MSDAFLSLSYWWNRAVWIPAHPPGTHLWVTSCLHNPNQKHMIFLWLLFLALFSIFYLAACIICHCFTGERVRGWHGFLVRYVWWRFPALWRDLFVCSSKSVSFRLLHTQLKRFLFKPSLSSESPDSRRDILLFSRTCENTGKFQGSLQTASCPWLALVRLGTTWMLAFREVVELGTPLWPGIAAHIRLSQTNTQSLWPFNFSKWKHNEVRSPIISLSLLQKWDLQAVREN